MGPAAGVMFVPPEMATLMNVRWETAHDHALTAAELATYRAAFNQVHDAITAAWVVKDRSGVDPLDVLNRLIEQIQACAPAPANRAGGHQ